VDSDIEAACAAGRREAETFDARLRAEEAGERHARLAEVTKVGEDDVFRFETPLDVLRLRAQVEDLSRFRRAVLGSLAWKVTQAARRLVGRAW
jgi:hypothetical protein